MRKGYIAIVASFCLLAGVFGRLYSMNDGNTLQLLRTQEDQLARANEMMKDVPGYFRLREDARNQMLDLLRDYFENTAADARYQAEYAAEDQTVERDGTTIGVSDAFENIAARAEAALEKLDKIIQENEQQQEQKE